MYKIVALLLICLLSLQASNRPKIGLVLSGGGARGGAHIGAIKMFEKYNIPIDAIAGTSMGAFMGGLYASGIKSSEIEEMLVTANWNELIVAQTDRRKTPFRKKVLERDLVGNMKLGVNSENDIVLPSGVFQKQFMLDFLHRLTIDVSNVENFDELEIPFRAVATNALNGEAVVLSRGSLAEAIYASLAIPGGFEPIEIEGKTLFDGGIADNLPVDVMREMGVDIIIVIDISTPFDMDVKVDSYLSVMSQLTNILARKNVEETIKSLRENELFVVPELGELATLDSDKYPVIIAIGEKTINDMYEKRFKSLSIDENEYAQYRESINKVSHFKAPVIDTIEFHNSVDISDEVALHHLHVKEGDVFDIDKTLDDIEAIYNLGIYASVDYHLEYKDEKTILVIDTTPAYNSNGQIRFSMGFSDDFNGRGNYQLKAEYSKYNITDLGGEWRTQGGIGDKRHIFSELYLPMDYMQEYFFRPNVIYLEDDTHFSASAYGLSDNIDDTIEFLNKVAYASLVLGKVISPTSQIEVGFNVGEKERSTNVLVASNESNNSALRLENIKEKSKLRNLYARYMLDSMDNTWFPTTGYLVDIKYTKEAEFFGSNFEYDKIESRFIGAFSHKKHTFIAKYIYDTTIYVDKKAKRDDVFSLGGYSNLSGYPTNSFLGESKMLLLLSYRYRLTDDQLFGSIGVPMYAGANIESGKAFSERIYPVSSEGILTTTSVYIAADSIIGPIHLAYAETFNNSSAVYLYVGSVF